MFEPYVDCSWKVFPDVDDSYRTKTDQIRDQSKEKNVLKQKREREEGDS